MLKNILIGLGALSVTFGAVASASAAPRTIHESVSADELRDVLTAAGLNPTIINDRATGSPVATGQTEGMIFVVRAMDCAGVPSRCGQLILFANFDLGREITEQDFRVVNMFNETSVHGRAYVLENKRQIGVDYVIDMTGGVTGEHIGSRLGRWPDVIREFRDRMRRAQGGS